MNGTGADAGISYPLRVGVTGHRQLPDDPALRRQIRGAVDLIRRHAPSSAETPLRLVAVSPLAEGADRLVAGVVLEEPEAMVEVPYPAGHFNTAGAGYASEQSWLPEAGGRVEPLAIPVEGATASEVYEQVGRYVVDTCDVLLAVWDGEASRGRGGTAEIVGYARRDPGIPIVMVAAKPPYEVTFDQGRGVPTEPFRDLDRYNRSTIGGDRVGAEALDRTGDVVAKAADVGLEPGLVREVCNWVMAHFVRADLSARRVQAASRLAGALVFAAAGLAVAAVAAQVVFAPDRPELAVAEVGLLVVALAALMYGRAGRVHERWIEYRALAERFRAALYLAAAGAGTRPERIGAPPPWKAANHWVSRALDEVWSRRPAVSHTDQSMPALRQFLVNSWLDEQIAYHRAVAAHCERWHRRLTAASYVMFGMTLIAAILHVVDVGDHESGRVLEPGHIVVFLAITLPVATAAMAGIHAQRQYERNAERSHGMVLRLLEAKKRLARAPDLSRLQGEVSEIAAGMLTENEDWIATMRFQEIRPG